MQATPFLPGLSPVGGKSLTATFDAGSLSSDGGLVVLARGRASARFRRDDRPLRSPMIAIRPASVYSYADMARARMALIAAGYEDATTSMRCAPIPP